MKKPQNCAQKWLEMKPTEGGRLCGKCNKTIVDFSRMNWKEIENLQMAHNNSLCGMYSKKQLAHWGQEPPNRTKSYASGLAITSFLLAGSSLATSEGIVQTTKAKQMAVDSSDMSTLEQTGKKKANTVVKGTIVDKEGEPVVGASVFIVNDIKNSTYSDLKGRFKIKTKRELNDLKGDTLVVQFADYESLRIPLSKWVKDPCSLQLMLEKETDIIAFYVDSPSSYHKAKWWLKNGLRKPE